LINNIGLHEKCLQDLLSVNMSVLHRIFDRDEGVFSYKVYIDNPLRISNNLRLFLAVCPFNILNPPIAFRRRNLKVESALKDLKYIGHACVGLTKYILTMDKVKNSSLNMLHSNLEYLMYHQSSFGASICRYIHSGRNKSGTDVRSIAETTASLLWAFATGSRLYKDDRNLYKKIIERANKAAIWLMSHKEFLIPQEMGRFIYGLSELHDVTQERKILLCIEKLCEELTLELDDYKSFGSFPNDIDVVGGLSLGSCIIGRSFHNIAKQLVSNILTQQGVKGEWRWSFNKKSGHYRRLLDLTYTVHQLGMAPWSLSLYLATAHWDFNVDKALRKGILWIIKKKAIHHGFVIRSFFGLTGNVYELEQRCYEPGLNLLGLISYTLIKGMKLKGIPLDYKYVLSPFKLIDDFGIHPYQLIR